MTGTTMEESSALTPALGCVHYRRGCQVLAECCKEWVACRLCHDEQFRDHQIDRHAVQQMKCLACKTEQPCARDCGACGARMGEYFCSYCNLFDHEGEKKQIFHCDDCRICRVGGRDNFFHCATCCGCYPLSLQNNHTCLAGSMHRECAVCLEGTFASREQAVVMPCGHVLHNSCWKACVENYHHVCPMCRTPLFSNDEDSHNSEDNNENDEEANDTTGDDGDPEDWETMSESSQTSSSSFTNADDDEEQTANDDDNASAESSTTSSDTLT